MRRRPQYVSLAYEPATAARPTLAPVPTAATINLLSIVARPSSRLPGLRSADDHGFNRLRVGRGGVESNSDDDPLKAVHDRVTVIHSERRRALKHRDAGGGGGIDGGARATEGGVCNCRYAPAGVPCCCLRREGDMPVRLKVASPRLSKWACGARECGLRRRRSAVGGGCTRT